MNDELCILAIESSCDDTSAAVSKGGCMLSNLVANQHIHSAYGGVVPELASRAHQVNIVPVVDQALKTAGIEKDQLHAIAFTKGPGLLGSLLVGTSFAKALALGLNIPLIEVNHMQAHVMSHFIIQDGREVPGFPFLCLTVSGGHTEIVLVKEPMRMHVLGQTIDDAVGEAFDKAAKVLKLPYPGGPLIDQLAQEGNAYAFEFPRPDVPGLNYSFSGMKTAFLYFINSKLLESNTFVEERMADICASYQRALIETVLDKFMLAIDQSGATTIGIAGGVAANSYLRMRMEQIRDQKQVNSYIPELAYCTDNAAMIAITGHYKYLNGMFSDQAVSADARHHFDPAAG